ncbi:SRPBCC family protein [Streptomyces sp. NBC_00145]|uniref:SRPBCC family protein n=1 Tax=Streptomyces sp. NBC_00145 TaxID=2975666 RepID=UPI002E18C31D
MQFQHSFSVPVPVATAWDALLDVERVAPSLPGASVTSREGDEFTGSVKVKLGAIQLTYRGRGKFTERDEEARRVVLEAGGKDVKGGGTVNALILCTLSDEDEQTRVDVTTDLAITGRPAQFGRGLLNDVGSKIIAQFSENLAASLRPDEPPTAVGTGAAADGPSVDGVAADVPEPLRRTEPLDLLQVAGPATLKRLAPAALGLVLAVVAVLSARRTRAMLKIRGSVPGGHAEGASSR